MSFLGFQPADKLVQFYSSADAYAYPTPREDFGLGPVEAMACGTPAVVWNDGGGPCETVIDGKTGLGQSLILSKISLRSLSSVLT